MSTTHAPHGTCDGTGAEDIGDMSDVARIAAAAEAIRAELADNPLYADAQRRERTVVARLLVRGVIGHRPPNPAPSGAGVTVGAAHPLSAPYCAERAAAAIARAEQCDNLAGPAGAETGVGGPGALLLAAADRWMALAAAMATHPTLARRPERDTDERSARAGR